MEPWEMVKYTTLSMAVIPIFFSLLLFSFSEATTNGGGAANSFTTSLFHRDSLLSPLHNPSLSHYDRLTNAFRRSFSRSATFLINRATAASTADINSPVIAGNGEFLMSISIGTPPVNFTAIADTGSDLTWTQCLPCRKCFNQSLPIFSPSGSSSYSRLACTTDTCRSLDDYRCAPDGGRTCNYAYSYGDGSFTYGDLASDKITIGSFELKKTVIGCGHNNGGVFGGAGSGIIGLGGGDLSLVSQLSKMGNLKRQFSYCLPDFINNPNVTGKINFGEDTTTAVFSGPNVVSTPLVPKSPNTFYYLTLEAMSIANKRFTVANATMSSTTDQPEGNIIIDSGTTLTILPPNLYDELVAALTSVIKAKQANDPSGILKLCYAARSVDDLDIPIINAHFSGGAVVKLLPLNTFALVAENVTCLAFVPSLDVAIFGNLAQMNFLIGYDLEQKRLSFKPTICT